MEGIIIILHRAPKDHHGRLNNICDMCLKCIMCLYVWLCLELNMCIILFADCAQAIYKQSVAIDDELTRYHCSECEVSTRALESFHVVYRLYLSVQNNF